MSSMKMLFWNCRGAGNEEFKANMTDLVREHDPDMVALIETKVPLSSIGNYFEQFGYIASTYTDPVGRVGGIWILWNPSILNMRDMHISSQCIHMIITKNNYEEWLLSTVYASPSFRCRELLWENLKTVADSYNIPWLVASDFNDHGDSSEKRSFSRSSSQNRSSIFINNINSCGLTAQTLDVAAQDLLGLIIGRAWPTLSFG
ncbi:hypothetical protein LguiB_024931 [Lonicera macranthoides]